ncbi:MAG: hypothetical protein R2748_02960 [Bryobacterales bacterium]
MQNAFSLFDFNQAVIALRQASVVALHLTFDPQANQFAQRQTLFRRFDAEPKLLDPSRSLIH